jgi:isopenicillin-N epimerase
MSTIKEQFLLDPSVIFLNHGSFGACPQAVFEEYQSWQWKLERQPVKFLGRDLNEFLFHARQTLGTYLNAPVGDIVFIPNATHGVNITARSLNLHPGDEILTTDHEYGACDYTWEFICSKVGAVYKKQHVALPVVNDSEITEQIWQGVTSKTKLIFLSHITSPTSLIMPVKEICQRARLAGILTLVDGAHAPGQMSIDLVDIAADFYVGNCHKWMLSPKGAGFLYVSPQVQHLIEPLIVSWGYQSRSSPPRESTFVDLLQWTGTQDPSAALSVPFAIDFMQAHHWEDVRMTCHQMLTTTCERIHSLTGLEPLYPFDSNFYMQMATIPLREVKDLELLKNRLYAEYKIEIPCIYWNNRQFLRLSIQGYNTQDDLDQFVNALRILLPECMDRNE